MSEVQQCYDFFGRSGFGILFLIILILLLFPGLFGGKCY
jgi:hypothetical protein